MAILWPARLHTLGFGWLEIIGLGVTNLRNVLAHAWCCQVHWILINYVKSLELTMIFSLSYLVTRGRYAIFYPFQKTI